MKKKNIKDWMTKEKIYARWMTLACVRNSSIENIHAGKALPKKYLKGYSRITESEMRELMLEVEYKIKHCLHKIRTLSKFGLTYSFDNKEMITEEKFIKAMREALFGKFGVSWDDPTLSKT